jgi:hypothetical protein
MTAVEQFDYVVGLERALANSRGAVDALRELADAAKSWLEPEGSRGYAHPAMTKARQTMEELLKLDDERRAT